MASIPTGFAVSSLVGRALAIWSLVTNWISKLFLAVVDQGLISGSNFVIGVLLARWMTPERYGGYALAFSAFLLLSQGYSSLLLEPMAVFGSGRFRYRLQGYLGSLVWLHIASALLIFVILAASAVVARALGSSGNLPSALAGASLAAPCVLLLWLARRAYYLELKPGPAVLGAILYCTLVLGGLFLIYRQRVLSSFTAFLLMAIGALFTSLLLLKRVKPVLGLSKASPNLRETWQQHWDYGRWSLATAVLVWMPSNIYFLILSGFAGMADTGVLKALTNIALPVGHTATAMSLLFQTYAARVHEDHGVRSLKGFSREVTALYAGGAFVYWIVIVVFRQQVVHLLYGGNYAGLSQLVPWLALASLLQLSIAGPTIGLRAMESPASVFVAYGASGAVSLLAGIPLAWAYGIHGVIASMMLASTAGLVTSYVLLHRKAKNMALVAA